MQEVGLLIISSLYSFKGEIPSLLTILLEFHSQLLLSKSTTKMIHFIDIIIDTFTLTIYLVSDTGIRIYNSS